MNNVNMTVHAQQQAIIQATRAAGTIIHIDDSSFVQLLNKASEPLVVMAEGGLFTRSYQYVMSYKGLCFFTKSSQKLPIPPTAELIKTKRIWVP